MRQVILAAATAAFFSFCAPADAQSPDVVRVADVPQSRYQELSRIADFWGIDRRHNAVIMAVNAEQRRAIEALGFEVHTDEQRMRSQRYARSFDADAWRQSGMRGIPGYPCYRTVDETKTDLSAMATARPDLARWEPIGDSWLDANGQPGGDDLYVLVLGNQNSPHDRAPFILMAAQHARELTTAETAARFAEWLFDNYDTDPTARWLLDHREIHIIAQQNPDGRREVEDGASMWRKNSNLNACPGGTPGVDLNRNSNFFWGDFSDGSACSQTYRGESEASEPETQAVQDYMHQVFQNHWPGDSGSDPVPADADGLFISLHSFSELILFPWEGSGSGTANNAPNHNQLAWLGRKFGFFTGYEVGRDILYSAGGTMTDYAHGAFGVAAYTYEIGTSFQQSCGSFENGIIQDQLDALIYAAKASRRPYAAPSGPDILDPAAIYNAQTDRLTVTGLADGARFDRGGVGEAPADDPVHDIAEIRASFDLPPDQAADWFSITPDASDNVSTFVREIDPQEAVNLPQLLFLQATDSQGHTGVPEAVWIVEQRAAIEPSSLSASAAAGMTAQRTLTISNIGSTSLDWSLAADLPVSGRAPDPSLAETLALADFTLTGNGTHQASASAGEETRGQVVGFGFEGTVTGLDGNSTWASDMALTISSPQGTSYSVGGFNTGNPPWDFDGDISSGNGTYTSEHIGDEIFGTEGTGDEGFWQFDFEHTYNDTMSWSDVTVTLHKQALPECVDPSGVAWIAMSSTTGSLAPGEDQGIELTLDASALEVGQYEALLCITTNDPAAELVVVDVTFEVTGTMQRIFEDRFESTLR